MTFFITLSIAIGFVVGCAIVYLIAPKTNAETFYVSKDSNIPVTAKKLINFIGGDLLALIPSKVGNKSINNVKVEKAIHNSGNPWNVTKVEFFLIRIISTILCFLLFILMFFTMGEGLSLILRLFAGTIVTYAGWMWPLAKYETLAKERESAFKMGLPEAIDYLTMVMSSGNQSLQNAFGTVIEYLPEGVVKHEFEIVVRSIDSGQTMQTSLNQLAERAPTEGISSFVKALNNANMNNVPMNTLLKNRAEASRKDLDVELEIKIKTIPYKVLALIGPTAFFGVLAIASVPSIHTIMGM